MTLTVEMKAMRVEMAMRKSAATVEADGRQVVTHVLAHLDPAYGGISSLVPALAANTTEMGLMHARVAAFCPDHERFRPAILESRDVAYWPLSRSAWLRNRSLQTAFTHSLSEASCVHVHGLWEQGGLMACKAARCLQKPYVISAHGMLEPWALSQKRLKKRIYAALIERGNVRGATCLHALTKAEALNYRSFGATSPIAIIPNAVEVPTGIDYAAFFSQYPQLQDSRIALFMGRIHPKKGIDLLLQSWVHVIREHADVHLVLAGPGSVEARARLAEQIEASGMSEHITYTGMLDTDLKWSALKAAEVFVLPSYSEGLSMSVLEAMGVGVPVVVTTACNIPEASKAGAGWEVAADVSALTSALLEVFEGSSCENKMIGAKGQALVRSQFSWPRVMEQFNSLYKFVLDGELSSDVEMVGT